ncbi:MAG: DUF1707 SHOCT-like domain-containing protein [Brooklawnia sp.]|jgi:hypothetical protein
MNQPSDEWQPRPRLRAGDADRQQAIESLTLAWRAGRLSREEFQDRTERSLAATYSDEVVDLVADIGGLVPAPVYEGELVQDSWQSEREDNLPVRYAAEGERGAAISVGVLGGMDRAGDWVVAPHHTSLAFWGGGTIDLRDAVFTSPETTITCIAVMGGIEVIVPPEMEVRVTGFGLLGGFGWEKVHQARQQRQAPEGAPRVIIQGLGLMGGVEVTRRERGAPD